MKSSLTNNKKIASLFYILSNIINKAIAFITVPIFTRLLTPNEYGTYTTYLSWVNLLMCIVGLSMGQSLRSASTDFKHTLNDYIASVYLLSFIDLLLTFGVVTIFIKYFNFAISLQMFILCIWHSYMRFIVNVYEVKYMMELNFVKRSALLAMPNICISFIAVLLIQLFETHKEFGLIYSYVVVYSVIGISYFTRTLKNSHNIFSKKYWLYALSFSIPLLLNALSNVLLANSDQIMITFFRGSDETAIYALTYSMGMVPQAVYLALQNIWIPWFTQKVSHSAFNEINTYVKSYISISTGITCVIMLISPEILQIMAPSSYWGGKTIIPPIMLSSFVIFLYAISVDAEYYYKQTKVIAFNTVIAAIINVLLNAFFIPKYGGIGAACTTFFSYSVSMILHIRAMKKINPTLFPIRIYLKPILIILITILLYYSTLKSISIRWLVAIVIGLITLYYILCKDNILNVPDKKDS